MKTISFSLTFIRINISLNKLLFDETHLFKFTTFIKIQDACYLCRSFFDEFLIFVEVFENLSIRTKIAVPDCGFVFDDSCLEIFPGLANLKSNKKFKIWTNIFYNHNMTHAIEKAKFTLFSLHQLQKIVQQNQYGI